MTKLNFFFAFNFNKGDSGGVKENLNSKNQIGVNESYIP